MGTFEQMVAWDGWAAGRGDQALGKITGDLRVGLASFFARPPSEPDLPVSEASGSPMGTA